MGQIAQRVLRALGLRKACDACACGGGTKLPPPGRIVIDSGWPTSADATLIEAGPILGSVVRTGGLSANTANIGGLNVSIGSIKPD